MKGQAGWSKGDGVRDEGKGDDGGPADKAHSAGSRASGEERVKGVEVVGAARPVPVAGHEVIEPGGAEPKEGSESALLVRLLHPHRVKYLLPVYVACVLVVMVM